MNWLTINQQQAIRRHATAIPEVETCGFVLRDGTVVQVPNYSPEPADHFVIDPEDYAAYEELGIAGIWHSHLTNPGFSPTDQNVLRADNLPWAIYCLATDSFAQVNPSAPAPLLGRPFCYGIYDCYSLVCDYLSELGVAMPFWVRGSYGEWNTPEFVPFDEEHAGLGPVVDGETYQPGDLLFMNLGDYKNHIDHIAVFNSSTTFIHHLADKTSRIDRFSSYWKPFVKCVIRPYQLCA